MKRLYEYASSAGEGTLIEHGSTPFYAVLRKKQQEALRKGHTMIFQRVAG